MENSLFSNKFFTSSAKGSRWECMQNLAEILNRVKFVEKYLTQKTEE